MKLKNFCIVLSLLILSAASYANAEFTEVLNLPANQYGEATLGHNAYKLNLGIGDWKFEIVSPDTNGQATYWAWQAWSNSGPYHTATVIWDGISREIIGGHNLADNPQDAFWATINGAQYGPSIILHYSVPTDVYIGVSDSHIGDNTGGISILVTSVSIVTDSDGDGIPDDEDICPGGDDNIDGDEDGIPDFCDVCPLDPENDADGDGLCSDKDNCPLIANGDQINTDEDNMGDACDTDDDNDNHLDEEDNCQYDYNPDQADYDNDSEGDVCDKDDDNDEIPDATDQCLSTNPGEIVNETGCSITDLVPCNNPWKNHGAYVSNVAKTAENFLTQGLITEEEKERIVSDAANSTCGKK